MDLNDEFQFKPLSEGLGFHPKRAQTRKQVVAFPEVEVQKEPASAKPKSNFELRSALPGLDFDEPTVGQEISHAQAKVTLPKPSVKRVEFEPLLKQMQSKVDASVSVKTIRVQPEDVFAPTRPQILAFVIDGLFVSALFLFALAGMMLFLKFDIAKLLLSPVTQVSTQMGLGILFFGLHFVYLVISRWMFAATLGEWSQDMRVGRVESFERATYGFRVLFRQVFQTIGIFLFFPLLSAVLKMDFVGRFFGAEQLQRET